MPWFPLAVSLVSVAAFCLAVSRASMDLGSGLGLMFGLFILGAVNVGVWIGWAVTKLVGA